MQPASSAPDDKGGFVYALLGFLIPIVGLVLWLAWHRARPADAKRAIHGFIANIVLCALVLLALAVGANGSVTVNVPGTDAGGATQTQGSSSGEGSGTSGDESGTGDVGNPYALKAGPFHVTERATGITFRSSVELERSFDFATSGGDEVIGTFFKSADGSVSVAVNSRINNLENELGGRHALVEKRDPSGRLVYFDGMTLDPYTGQEDGYGAEGLLKDAAGNEYYLAVFSDAGIDDAREGYERLNPEINGERLVVSDMG